MTNLLIKIGILFSLMTLMCCNETPRKQLFIDNIRTGDTLTLFAQFSECGEWGGHIEKIYLTKGQQDMQITFLKDSINCYTDPNTNRKTIINKTQKLRPQDKNVIGQYIDSVIVNSKNRPKPLSNAWNIYKIFTRDSVIQFNDWGMKWNLFDKTRDKIFME